MIENSNICLLDTNILVYAFDKDEQDKNSIASKIVEKIINNELSIVLSIQNLSEFYYVITRKIPKPIPQSDAKNHITKLIFLSNIKVFGIKAATIINAIDITIEFNIPYWDALIAAVMKENSIHKIITENESDFKKVPWLTVINPFKK